MKIQQIIPVALLFLLAAKADPLRSVSDADRELLRAGLKRYSADEIKRNFSDLYDIQDQDVATRRELGLSDDGPPVDRATFENGMKSAIEGGSAPTLQSFELTEVIPIRGHYMVRACSTAQRENFHYKGIIEFDAFIQDGKVRFGAWRFKFYSPHSCSQQEDSPI
jgi:hypothetical protein